MNNILLINPWAGESFPPPAIGYLQAALRHALPNAEQVEVVARDLQPALDLLSRRQFDFVGVSFHSFSVKYARAIRGAVTSGRLIAGGHHPSSSLGYQLEREGYEVIRGEGEEQLVNIVAGTPVTARFATIDDYPFPEYDGLTGYWFGPSAVIPVISSRGCPFGCSFCASSAFWDRKWRPRSPSNVLAEIESLVMAGHRAWMFEDDNFTLDKNRASEICIGIQRLAAKVGPLSWECASRSESLRDLAFCRLLVASGCHTAWLGVESLSQPVLDRCGKNTTVAAQEEGIRTAAAARLGTVCQFIVGLPGDTQADIDTTAARLADLPCRRAGANIAWILPDTAIHAAAKERGFDDEVYLTHGAPFYSYEQTPETLQRWRMQINNAKGGR